MGQQMLDYIGHNGDASFAELTNMFGEEAGGHCAVEFKPNVFLWAGVSQLFIDALASIKHLLECHITSAFVYLRDGRALILPVAQRVPDEGFAMPHWVPVILKIRHDIKDPGCAMHQWRSR
jgi:hypothetical protein